MMKYQALQKTTPIRSVFLTKLRPMWVMVHQRLQIVKRLIKTVKMGVMIIMVTAMAMIKVMMSHLLSDRRSQKGMESQMNHLRMLRIQIGHVRVV